MKCPSPGYQRASGSQPAHGNLLDQPMQAALLLLIGVYLHKKALCQDHHSSKQGPPTWHRALLAQRTVSGGGEDVSRCGGGKGEQNCSSHCDQGLYPGPLIPLSAGLVPGPVLLPWQHLEEQDEAAQEAQIRSIVVPLSPRGLHPTASAAGRLWAQAWPC